MADQLRTLVYKVQMDTADAKAGGRTMQLTMKTMEQDAEKAGKSVEELAKTIDSRYNTKTKVMIDTTKTAKAELQAASKQASRSEQNFNRLSREYKQLSSRVGRTADQQEQLNAIYRLGANATLTQKKRTLELVKAYQLQRNASISTQGSMRGLRGQMQNIGFQAQDIAVQMQQGTNAMVIFSQQGSQLAAGFGPTGALVGAGIAFAGMLGSLLVPSLMKAGDGVDELIEKLEKLAKSTGLTTEQAEILIAKQVKLLRTSVKEAKQLETKISVYEKGIKTYAEYEKQQIKAAVSAAAVGSKYTVVTKSLEDWTSEQIKNGQENKKRVGELQTLQKTIGDLQDKIKLYNSAIGDEGTEVQKKWSDSNKSSVESIIEQAKQIGKTRVQILQQNREQALLNLTNQKGTDVQKEAVKASFAVLIAYEKESEALKKREAEKAKAIKAQQKLDSIAARAGFGQLDALNDRYEKEQALFVGNQEALTALQKEYERKRIEINGSALEQYLVNAEEQLKSFDEIVLNSLDRFTEGFGRATADAIMGSSSVGEALSSIFTDVTRNMIAFFAEWAAQEAALWAIKKVLGTKGQTGAATTGSLNAQAAVVQAGINAYQATAAIPIVGPSLAPGAAASAIAATSPMAAQISGLMFAGMFDKGGVIPQGAVGIVSEYGDELVNGVLVRGNQGGTRVTSREETNNLLSNRGGDTFNITGNANASAEQIARALVRKLKRGDDKRLDNAIFESGNRGRKNGGKRYAS